jgi:hypothetical protein
LAKLATPLWAWVRRVGDFTDTSLLGEVYPVQLAATGQGLDGVLDGAQGKLHARYVCCLGFDDSD